MKKHAILIGVEDYRDKMISRLQFASADATALAQRLHDRCGFDSVRVLVDEEGEDEPLLVNIITALRDIAAELCPEDLFLFFFAGHGVEKDGHGYLLARDSLQAFPEHGSLSLELLRKTFACLNAGKCILLLDACRNDPTAGRSDADNPMGDAISRDIAAAARSQQDTGTATALLSACRSGQRAYEWPSKNHGVFTHFLIGGIDGAAWQNQKLDFRHLAAFTAGRVRNWATGKPELPTPQNPWYEEFGDPASLLLAQEDCSERSKQELSPSSTDHAQASSTGQRNRVRTNSRFVCPVCGKSCDADIGSLCKTCNAYTHHNCQKCMKKRKAFDWSLTAMDFSATLYTYVCPIRETVVRKYKR